MTEPAKKLSQALLREVNRLELIAKPDPGDTQFHADDTNGADDDD